MFTGLIQHVGTVQSLAGAEGGARLAVEIGPLATGARLGDSIAINGCCLTITRLNGTLAEFDAVPETLRRTNLGQLSGGARVNLEAALRPGDLGLRRELAQAREAAIGSTLVGGSPARASPAPD